MELTGRIQAWGDTNSRNRLAGVAITVLLAWAWSRYGRRVNLALFFQVTSIFLLLFALQLLLYSFHELTEAHALPIDNEYWNEATEAYAEGVYAQIYSRQLSIVQSETFMGYSFVPPVSNVWVKT